MRDEPAPDINYGHRPVLFSRNFGDGFEASFTLSIFPPMRWHRTDARLQADELVCPLFLSGHVSWLDLHLLPMSYGMTVPVRSSEPLAMTVTVDPSFLDAARESPPGRFLLKFSLRPKYSGEGWGQVRYEEDVEFTARLEPCPPGKPLTVPAVDAPR